jgi:hypothetical protein
MISRSLRDPLNCLRDLNAYIRQERHESRYFTGVRVLRFDYSGQVIARETYMPETDGGEYRNRRRTRPAAAHSVLNVLIPDKAHVEQSGALQ